MKFSPLLGVFAVVLAGLSSALADVTLPAIISDHMVLKKAAAVPIWGTAEPGEEVSVSLGNQSATTTADSAGNWSVSLNLAESAQGPFELLVSGKNKLKISDVVVGEVWLASGQSNMEWNLGKTDTAAEEIAASANPLIRQFLVTKNPQGEPTKELTGTWVVASPETSGTFSAVAYHFAKNLQAELKIPVGIIHSSWGGTPSEAWTSRAALDSDPELKETTRSTLQAIEDYPLAKAAYVNKFAAWLKANGREDVPVADASIYAGLDVPSEGWIPVTLPGFVRAPGLPEAGAVWVRKEIQIPKPPKDFMGMSFTINGFDSIYWNGKLLRQVTYEDYPGNGSQRRGDEYRIPASEINAGKNVLAIRLFEPVGPAEIIREMRVGAQMLQGEWLAKAEYTFPPLDPVSAANVPKPPASIAAEQYRPTFLFNGMIHPIVPYAISGVIWYQGEANASRAYQYRTAFPLLIQDWRNQWKQDDLPFYFCQLASYQAKVDVPKESAWAELREAQLLTLSVPKTGQAVLIDAGEAGDIHPRSKKEAGDRLARIALANDYGKSIPFSGPVYDAMKVEDGKIVLTFKHTDGGLVAKPLPETHVIKSLTNETAPLVRNSPKSELEGFSICGADGKWVWADAKIVGDTVVVSSGEVPNPVAVRYAWADNPTCNLYNGAGLPASPFRTDDYPISSQPKKL